MALYRYTSNKDQWDTTESIIVGYLDDGTEKVMHLHGDPVELSEDELAGARGRFNVNELTDKQLEAYNEEQSGGPAASPSRRTKKAAAKKAANEQPADDDAGGVVDPTQGGNAVDSLDSSAPVSDGQGTRGASGQDVGTTTGSTR